ncbi:MAG: hypothetical protein BECKG1743D_GA0114223_101753 [Candidatus Kentron sp. G]|nr:MAG: hypothetical protein BECKG1743F_GA0114225_101233 [Candidatus Kentron sp. G]VFM99132.1 MAG: hypothetical protein BECKG1743E_GA0114224_102343 [Candidatus Kentron sp. G]VFN00218.1 MAG: hypothetical protein BECKG1743D_GA0114223_101753 [Candidatus Kentron sp. G]
MPIYFPGNSAFSLQNFMTYRASLWDTIREAVKKSPAYCPDPQIAAGGVAKAPRFVMIGRHVARLHSPILAQVLTLSRLASHVWPVLLQQGLATAGGFFHSL